jgi:hypothetical protein
MRTPQRCRLVCVGVAALLAWLVHVGPAAADDVPPGIQPLEIEAEVDTVFDLYVGIGLDGYVAPDDFSAGIGASAHMQYHLTFWNVGALRPGYEAATITKVYDPYEIHSDPGEQVPAELYRTAIPYMQLTFSGGPAGAFTGTNPDTGRPVRGHIERTTGGGWTVVFTEDIKQTYVVTTPGPFAGWPTCTGSGDSGARLADVSRVVEIFPDANPDDVRSGKPGSALDVCDHVLTGEESSAIVNFPDLSVVRMRAESEIVILAPPSKPTRLEVLLGRIRMNVGKVLRGESIEVKTNLATLGIKGTDFVVDVADGQETLLVIEGEVGVTSSVSGAATIVTAGQSITASATGLSEVTTFDVAAEETRWAVAPPATGTTEPEATAPDEGSSTEGGGSDRTGLVAIGAIGAVVLVVGAVLLLRRRSRSGT